ncbi:MAG: 30S ribosome-binding factor RbfA [Acholeplasmatales bacterium]|jgi:ribosome-binding factor A|nr:30S ribosome-binding factor RbfA [Acholeplasmataceae bacterium]MDY0114950.1 30S ribosome-binding factor RbfA [Acholeplasmatales bacterium]MCK9233883.1 30S ribosome-binding factor RbfA [Acholeplasmataceae bacterium]MCK9289126.1 30S ribosome-binding factor RbfA [Acholeplasmataceae bacterium]MCK9427110.1 30S ribosome-binding factor RbfA [Acholeplasmataceae bacterium]
MSNLSVERLQSLFLRELAIIVNKDRKIENQPYFNITEVKITRDKSDATVYYTILSDLEEDIKKAEEILTEITKQVRVELAKKVNHLRRMPTLSFKYDDALAYGNKIENILQEINKETEK